MNDRVAELEAQLEKLQRSVGGLQVSNHVLDWLILHRDALGLDLRESLTAVLKKAVKELES